MSIGGEVTESKPSSSPVENLHHYRPNHHNYLNRTEGLKQEFKVMHSNT